MRLLVAIAVLGIVTLVANAGEILYNGIELPDTWPPQTLTQHQINVGDPQPEPYYLRDPPDVIPIEVGRQLFVDDFLIASSSLVRTFHQPVFYEGNPVLKPEMPWETHSRNGPMAMPFSGGVFWDPKDQVFKMFYMSGYNYYAGLAISEDGLNWERPKHEQRNGNNTLAIPNNELHGVWLDLEETDPARRFKMAWHRAGTYSTAVSADGIEWNRLSVLGSVLKGAFRADYPCTLPS